MRGMMATVLGICLVGFAPSAASAAPLDGLLESVAAAAAAESKHPARPVSNAPLVADATQEEALEARDLDALAASLERHDADLARVAAAKPLAPRP